MLPVSLGPEVSSIGEASRFDIVLHVESPGDTLEYTFTTAGYKRMFTTTSDLPSFRLSNSALNRRLCTSKSQQQC